MIYVRGFIAGFVSTLVFHQGLLGILYVMKATPFVPFNMASTKPFGVPAVVSLAFFGGVWGVVIAKLVVNAAPVKQLMKWIVYGAIGPTAVAVAVVFPLKGIHFQPKIIPAGLLLNGVWGLGCYLIMQIRIRPKAAG